MADILILDDDEQIIKMASMMLSREGYTVATAQDGETALEKISNDPPQLLLTDILMPGMDGIELIERCSQEFPELKIVAMSGGRRKISAEFNLKSAAMLGASQTLEKPFTRDHLVKAVRQQMQA